MIDVSLFGASVPAGTYSAGDIIPLKCIDGPSVVRSGRGAAYLKRLTSGVLINASGSATYWKVKVKNSDWVDDAASYTAFLNEVAALDPQSGAVQDGQNCPLTPNSSWEVVAECTSGGTTTIGNSIFCTIDIDYPSVSSIVDPKQLSGIPTSLENSISTSYQASDIESANWTTINVDMFKAGYEYALVKPELRTAGGAAVGFIKISNAAGMAGLTRIIPTASNVGNLRNNIEYASKLVKGPMDLSLMLFSQTGSAVTGVTAYLNLDFVKRRTA